MDPTLRQSYEARHSMLEALGKFVAARIAEGLEARRDHIGPMNQFLKIPAEPRVKTTDSFLSKALRVGKNYSDPLSQITDQVGIRYVVLLTSQIETVCEIIRGCDDWIAEISRDVAQEQRRRPNQFDYQSQHYLVRLKESRTVDGVAIDAGLACEIQVRTLLQHAFAELAHDTVYKPQTSVEPEIKRELAKTCALIETTDSIFKTVTAELARVSGQLLKKREMLCAVYEAWTGRAPSSDLTATDYLLDYFRDLALALSDSELQALHATYDFLGDRISEESEYEAFFEQPVVIAVYYWVSECPERIESDWPLDIRLLNRLFSHLGKTPSNLRH